MKKETFMSDKDFANKNIVDILNQIGIEIDKISLYEVQKILRVLYNIHITIGNSASEYWWEASKADSGTSLYEFNYSGSNDCGKWDCYEDALEDSIYNILYKIHK